MKYLTLIWLKAMQAKTAYANMSKIWELIQEVNVPIYKYYFEKLFAKLDTTNRGEIDLASFHKLVSLCREHNDELGELFEKYRLRETTKDKKKEVKKEEEINPNPVISCEQLIYLLKENQKISLTYRGALSLIQIASSFLYSEYGTLKDFPGRCQNPNAIIDYSNNEIPKIVKRSEAKVFKQTRSTQLPKGLTLMGLSNYFFAKGNDVFNEKAYLEDLTHTLSHYFINTSRFTYLRIDKSNNSFEFSAKNYSKYLLKGVRCIDISLIVFFNLINE